MRLLQIAVPVIIALGVIVPLIRGSIVDVKDHERLVVYRLGKAIGVRGPGRAFLLPIIEQGSKFDIRDDFNAKLVADYAARLGMENAI